MERLIGSVVVIVQQGDMLSEIAVRARRTDRLGRVILVGLQPEAVQALEAALGALAR